MAMFSRRLLLAVAVLAALTPATAAAEGFKLLSLSTLVGEIITFAILVWVVMKFVWPPLMKAIDERQKEIADGLAAGERGQQELLSAEEEKSSILGGARSKVADIVADGEKRRNAIIEAAKQDAETERARIVTDGKNEVEAERLAMRRHLEEQIGGLVVAGAAQILHREVGEDAHQDIIASIKKSL